MGVKNIPKGRTGTKQVLELFKMADRAQWVALSKVLPCEL